MDENKKKPEEVFKAITDTLEVSTSYWNHINEMYNNINQGEHETTDQLDQCIKDLVQRCQYSTENEKTLCQTKLLFHVTKHLEVKKWVRSKKKREEVTYKALLQYAKEHEMTVKDFNQHKSNGGVATATTIDEIKSFKSKKGNGYRSKGGPGRLCGKCSTSHLPRECPAWGKKCHKCGNKNHFSTCCRSKQKSQWNGKRPPMAGAHQEVPKVRTDSPGQDPEVDPPPKVPTA